MSNLEFEKQQLDRLTEVYLEYQGSGLYATADEFSEYAKEGIAEKLLNNGSVLQRRFARDIIIAMGDEVSTTNTAYDVADGSRFVSDEELEAAVEAGPPEGVVTSEQVIQPPAPEAPVPESSDFSDPFVDELFAQSGLQALMMLQEIPPMKYELRTDCKVAMNSVGGERAVEVQSHLVARVLAPLMEAAGITSLEIQPRILDPWSGELKDVHLQDAGDQVAWGRSVVAHRRLNFPVPHAHEDPTEPGEPVS